MVDFAQLRNQKDTAAQLNEQLAKLNQSSGESKGDDDRFWSPSYDKNGNSFSLIRFLSAPQGEDVPFVRRFEHGFRGPESGQYIFTNCPTTHGKDCPICEMNKQLWATELKANRDWVSKESKRKLSYYANIYVIKDENSPENEGKVFLYRFGQKVMDLILRAANPEYEEEPRFDAFNMWTGANLRLKLWKDGKFPQYDRISFAPQSPLAESDDEIEKIWTLGYSLQSFVSPDQFETYDEITKRLAIVMGTGQSNAPQSFAKDEPETRSAPQREQRQMPIASDDDGDDTLASLKSLIDDDDEIPF